MEPTPVTKSYSEIIVTRDATLDDTLHLGNGGTHPAIKSLNYKPSVVLDSSLPLHLSKGSFKFQEIPTSAKIETKEIFIIEPLKSDHLLKRDTIEEALEAIYEEDKDKYKGQKNRATPRAYNQFK